MGKKNIMNSEKNKNKKVMINIKKKNTYVQIFQE